MKKEIFSILAILFLINSVYALDIPGSWYGYVYINGEPAPNGLKIQAFVNNQNLPSGETTLKRGDGYYLIHVDGNEGDIVKFYIYDKEVGTKDWHMGLNKEQFDIYLESDDIDLTTLSGETKSITGFVTSSSSKLIIGIVLVFLVVLSCILFYKKRLKK